MKTQTYSFIPLVRILPVLALLVLLGLPSSANAIEFAISGDAQLGSNYIDFGVFPLGAPFTPAPGYGRDQVSILNPGLFSNAGVAAGEFGSIQSLNEGTGNIVLPSAFLTFNEGGSNLSLWATNVPAGTVGPYVFTQIPGGVIASFSVDGFIRDSNNPNLMQDFTSAFALTFAGQTEATVLSAFRANTAFTASFSLADPPPPPAAAAPEPASLALLGAGLLGLGGIRIRKLRGCIRKRLGLKVENACSEL